MRKLQNNSVIHVQTSALQIFHDKILPQVHVRIILIVGMQNLAEGEPHSSPSNHIPRLKLLKSLLANKWVTHVFMHNPEITHPDFSALPYGLKWWDVGILAKQLYNSW